MPADESDPAKFDRRPTMRQVAAEASVSLKTVSRVVNDEPGVSAEVAARVRQAVQALGYRPHPGASSLRRIGGRTHSIALLLEDVGNPYAAALQRSIEDVAAKRGVVVFAASLDENLERERNLAAVFADRRADGLIVMPAGEDHSHYQEQIRAGVRVVFVDRQPQGIAVDSVVTTNRSGTAEAVRILLENGHRRIGFVGDLRSIQTAEQRYAGFCDALQQFGVELDERLVRRDVHNVAAADGVTSELLDLHDPPTAIFTGKNTLTIGAVRALSRLGLASQIAHVGFDDFPLAELLRPSVTVVAQHPSEIGREAAHLLFARIDGESFQPHNHIVPTTLIRRASSEVGRIG